jgi:hypothetical protein
MSDPLQTALAKLPHGPEFRFLDRLIELHPGHSATAEYMVRGDEPFLAGHFPGEPLFPASCYWRRAHSWPVSSLKAPAPNPLMNDSASPPLVPLKFLVPPAPARLSVSPQDYSPGWSTSCRPK